jgi:hypothetical protein
METDVHADRRNRMAIHVVNHSDVYIVHSPVVVEMPGIPVASLVARAPVTEPVIDASVEADVRTPISLVIPVMAA